MLLHYLDVQYKEEARNGLGGVFLILRRSTVASDEVMRQVGKEQQKNRTSLL